MPIRRNRGKGRQRRIDGGFSATDRWFSVCSVGQDRVLSLNTVEHDEDRSFTAKHVIVECIVAGANSCMGQISLFGPTGYHVASSGPFLVGVIPRKVRVSWPSAMNVFLGAGTNKLVQLTQVCLGKAAPYDKSYLTFNGEIHFRSGAEEFNSSCPAVNSKTPLLEPISTVFNRLTLGSSLPGSDNRADVQRDETISPQFPHYNGDESLVSALDPNPLGDKDGEASFVVCSALRMEPENTGNKTSRSDD